MVRVHCSQEDDNFSSSLCFLFYILHDIKQEYSPDAIFVNDDSSLNDLDIV